MLENPARFNRLLRAQHISMHPVIHCFPYIRWNNTGQSNSQAFIKLFISAAWYARKNIKSDREQNDQTNNAPENRWLPNRRKFVIGIQDGFVLAIVGLKCLLSLFIKQGGLRAHVPEKIMWMGHPSLDLLTLLGVFYGQNFSNLALLFIQHLCRRPVGDIDVVVDNLFLSLHKRPGEQWNNFIIGVFI